MPSKLAAFKIFRRKATVAIFSSRNLEFVDLLTLPNDPSKAKDTLTRFVGWTVENFNPDISAISVDEDHEPVQAAMLSQFAEKLLLDRGMPTHFSTGGIMELLTDELRKILPPLYSQEHNKDPTVHIKFFTPDSNWTWYVTEGSEEEDGDFRFFGLVIGQAEEWGYFLLSELRAARGPAGLEIERDLYFKPSPMSQIRTT